MKNIDAILKELQEHIPELKNNPDEWKQFLTDFISERPDSTIDKRFKKELKKNIQNHLQTMNKKPKRYQWLIPVMSFGGGIVATAFIILPLLQTPTVTFESKISTDNSQDFLETEDTKNISAITIEEINENAFGDIQAEKEDSQNSSPKSIQAEFGGGLAESSILADEAISFKRTSLPYFPQEKINYEYEYSGEEIILENEKTKIYRKGDETRPLKTLIPDIKSLNIDTIDFNTFRDLRINNLSIKEDHKDYPYLINIDLLNQSIHINQDYAIWSQRKCGKEYCEYKSIKKEDVPSDKDVLDIGQKFLKKYGIDLSHVGEPKIEKYWETNGDIEPESFPNTLSITYPYKIGEDEIHENWGGTVGIRVTVDLVEKRVTDAFIPSLFFQSSSYKQKDIEEILQIASTGGSDGIKYNNPEKTVSLELNTPKKEIRRIWRTNKDGKREELFVEMLVFPVKESKEDSSWRKEIIVPLAKNFF